MTFGEKAAELAGFATSLLGWRPHEFWDCTPAELATALGDEQQEAQSMDRDSVERLRARFPDDRGS
jgi:uncharacterized phage protein (TIGR02216 family)